MKTVVSLLYPRRIHYWWYDSDRSLRTHTGQGIATVKQQIPANRLGGAADDQSHRSQQPVRLLEVNTLVHLLCSFITDHSMPTVCAYLTWPAACYNPELAQYAWFANQRPERCRNRSVFDMLSSLRRSVATSPSPAASRNPKSIPSSSQQDHH